MSYSGFFSGLCNCKRQSSDQPGVKWSWDHILSSKLELPTRVSLLYLIRDLFASNLGKCLSSSHLHIFIDLRGSAIESSSEKVGEAHNIVNLVGVIGSTSSNDTVWSNLLSDLGSNFRLWVSHGEDDGIFVESLEACFGENSRC